jgi:hypothetical protein
MILGHDLSPTIPEDPMSELFPKESVDDARRRFTPILKMEEPVRDQEVQVID